MEVGFPSDAGVKNLPANAGDTGDSSSSPGPGRSLGGGNGNPLQYFCLENSMDRGEWRDTVHGVAKSLTGLSEHKHTHTHTHTHRHTQTHTRTHTDTHT